MCVCVCVQPKKNSSSLKSLPKRDQVLGRVFAPQSVQSWDFAGAVERQNFCFEEINTEYQHHPRSGNRHKRPPPNKSAERPHKYTDSGNNAARSSFFFKLSGKVSLNTGVINSDKHVEPPPQLCIDFRTGTGDWENWRWQFVFVRDLCMFGIHRGKKRSSNQSLQSYCVYTMYTPTRG